MNGDSGGSVGRASAATALGILFSRFGGLLREIVFAAYFGAGPVFDAFVVAFRIPSTFRQFVAEGAFTVACLPHYQDARKDGPQAEAAFLAEVGSKWALLLALLSVALWAAMPWMVRLFAHGFKPGSGTFDLAVDLGRITAGFVWLVGLYGLLQAIAQARKSFFWPALAPLGMNLAMAGAVSTALLLGTPLAVGAHWLSWAVLVGGVLQILLAGWSLRHGVRPAFGKGRRYFASVIRTALPAAAGTAVWQMQVLAVTSLASMVGSGAISILFFADRLIQLPLALVGTAAGSAALPYLAEAGEEKRLAILDDALGQVWMVIFPTVVGLWLLAPDLVAVVYGHGRFDVADVGRVAAVLRIIALGLPASVTARVLASAFYSRKDTRTPAFIAAVVVGSVIISGYFWSHRFGLEGLAAALALGSWVQCLGAAGLLWRRGWVTATFSLRALPRMIVPLMVGAANIWVLRGQMSNSYLALLSGTIVGGVTMIGLLWLWGGPYWQQKIGAVLRYGGSKRQ